MSPEETAAAARRLDLFLREAARKTKMPELGGKKLAGNFRSLLAGAKARIEQAHASLESAVGEVSEQAAAAEDAARQIRSEAAEMRDALGEVLGNSPPPGGTDGGDQGRG